MSDGDAILRAVIDDPENDTPRLVYADWLDDHGRPAMTRIYRGDCWRWGANQSHRPDFTKTHPDLCDRLVYMPGATPGVVGLIDRGVVFIMAWWSSPSRLAFGALAKALRLCDPDGRLLVVVVDTDGIGEEFQSDLPVPLSHLSGAGKAVWVRGGVPFLATRYGSAAADLRQAIRETLGES